MLITKFHKVLIVLVLGLLLVGCTQQVMSYNAEFVDYTYQEDLVKNALKVMTIHNDDSYQELKTSLKGVFSDSLYNTYFSTETYNHGEFQPITLVIQSLKGDTTDSNQTVFKAEISLKTAGTVTNPTMLVTIKNNAVVKIERI
jgi:hypothetical protein